MALGAALIGAGASVVNSGFNLFGQSSANKTNRDLASQQNDYNLALQERAFDYNSYQSDLEYYRNLEMWNRQNEYNSPAAQIARYKRAGLNPNLIYGTGTASAGNASSSPQYTAARFQAPRAERATVSPLRSTFDPYQALQIGQALALQKAQRDQISAQAEYTRQETKNNALNGLIKAEELAGRKLTNREKDALFEPTIMQAHIENRRSSNQADLFNSQNKALQYDINKLKPLQANQLERAIQHLRITNDIDQFRLKLLKLGISDRDNAITRFASRLILANEDKINQLFNYLK
ncbi:DNA pilot protein [Tortoise microvirus 35]|nr:DNA pilot protein [Tortoise microvirus 35]